MISTTFSRFALLFALVLRDTSVFAIPTAVCEQQASAKVSLVGLLSDVPSLENLFIRDNGDILVTSTKSSTLFQISPSNLYAPVAIGEVPGYTGLLGIAEMEKGIFYVIASNLTETSYSNAVWQVNLRDGAEPRSGSNSTARISHVADFSSAQQLNGMTRLSPSDADHILLSDSANGTITRLNVRTGLAEVILNDPTMQPLSSGLGIGVNGIHTLGSKLFFTNLDQKVFASIPISPAGLATGPVEILATNITFQDDFSLSPCGTRAWIATNGPMEIFEVDILSKVKRIRATSPFLGSSSSVAASFANSSQQLYVTGTLSIGNSSQGSVARIDLSS
ncbi:hypothetical protein EDB80DRAFT_557973 [Ilyonectria destructans]|nr:hypothetical protein EDB80DRAFT_557973 [Ilyonectria destructans]